MKKIKLKSFLFFTTMFLGIISAFAISAKSISSVVSIHTEKELARSENICKQVRDLLAKDISTLNDRFSELEKNLNYNDFNSYNNKPEEAFFNIVTKYFPWTSQDDLEIASLEFYFKNGNDPILINTAVPSVKQPFSTENPYYVAGLKTVTKLGWLGYVPSSDTVDAVKIIYHPDTFQTLGYFIIKLKERFFLTSYCSSYYSTLTKSDLFIVDSNNIIVSSKNVVLVGQPIDEKYNIPFESYFTISTIKEDSEYISGLQLASSKYLPPWRIIVVSPQEYIMSDLMPTFWSLAIIFLLCFIIYLFWATKLSVSLAKPIYNLVDYFCKLENEQFEEAVYHGKIQEIDYLFQSFNKMKNKIQILINDNYKQTLLRQDAQIKSLRRQINPHFLFNTLDMINWKSRMHDTESICHIVKSLSNILNLTIDRNDSNLYTMKEELGCLKDYAYIMLERYGDRLSIMFDIEDGLENILVPKLLMQPLLENAIKHGVMKLTSQGKINITAFTEQSMLKLCITDNGSGISLEELRKLNALIESDKKNHFFPTENVDYCTAIRNITHRLYLLYNNQYSFDIQSALLEKTTVTIKIPIFTIDDVNKFTM